MTDDRFLFKADTGEMFTLNGTGALVYRLYRDGLAPDAIARRLAARYELRDAEALDDVRAFLVQLRIHGFLVDA